MLEGRARHEDIQYMFTYNVSYIGFDMFVDTPPSAEWAHRTIERCRFALSSWESSELIFCMLSRKKRKEKKGGQGPTRKKTNLALEELPA
jgi:hypothetical protein